MGQTITITIDGVKIKAKPEQTVMQAADDAGITIPRLCYFKGLPPHGSCRVCVVKINGRVQPSCTQPVAEGMIVESEGEEIKELRRNLVDMLFIEGNHICPACEKSGNCELQGLAYQLDITAPKYPYQYTSREIDASHPDILLDLNRCILCSRCIRTSRDIDGKTVFEFIGRGSHKRIAVNSNAGLVGTNIDLTDQAVNSCPVGSILKKHVGFAVPVGERIYDKNPVKKEK